MTKLTDKLVFEIEGKKRSYAIIGSGAIGGYYGALLQRAGFDVHFLFRSVHESILQHGLVINEKDNDFILPSIKAYSHVNGDKKMPACDIIIIALKTTQNKYLKQLLPSLLKENTAIVIMQNGLGSEEDIEAITTKHIILSAITSIGAVRNGPGIIQIRHNGIVKLSPYTNSLQAAKTINNIVADFGNANIPLEVYHDYLLARWQKLLWNILFNGFSLIEQSTVDIIAKNFTQKLRELATEIIAIAAAYNQKIPLEYFENMLTVTKTLTGYKTSMAYDFEQKKPLEIEYLYAKPLAAAKAKNLKCPLLEGLYKKLKDLDVNNR